MATRLVFLALILLPAGLSAQDQRLQQRLDAVAAGQVQAILDSAVADGLPSNPLVLKALEGAAKAVPGARIVTAVHDLLLGLRQARQLLGPGEAEDLLAAALWLRGGGSPEAVSTLRRQAPTRSLAVPLTVMADLVGRGISGEEALAGAVALLQSDRGDPDFLFLRDRISQATMSGVSPAAILAQELNRLGVQPGTPR